MLQCGFDLHGDPFLGDTGLPLLQALAAAEDGGQSRFQGGQHLLVHVLVGFAHGAPLTVAQDHIFAADVGEHFGGNFAGIGPGVFGVHILRADGNAGFPHGSDGGGNADGRNAQDNIAPAALGQRRFENIHKFPGLAGGFIHLPVAGNDGFAVFSIHSSLRIM